MKAIRKEIIIGILAVVGIVILYSGTKFLKGNNVFSSADIYHASYKNVSGLQVGRPVTLNGYKVGQINRIQLMDASTNPSVLVTFGLEEDMILPSNTIARIYDMDIMGAKGIELDLGDAAAMLQAGDTLMASVAPGMVKELMKKVEPFIQEEMEPMMLKVNTALDNFNALTYTLNAEINHNKADLRAMIHNFKSVSDNLVSLSDSLEATVVTYNDLGKKLDRLQLENTVKSMNGVLGELDKTLTAVNSDQGTIGLMLNDKALYNNLQSSVKEMELLLTDMREHPKRYVHFSIFGRKDKETNQDDQ